MRGAKVSSTKYFRKDRTLTLAMSSSADAFRGGEYGLRESGRNRIGSSETSKEKGRLIHPRYVDSRNSRRSLFGLCHIARDGDFVAGITGNRRRGLLPRRFCDSGIARTGTRNR